MKTSDHHNTTAPTLRDRSRHDSGSTFIELLVSIVLLGLASVGTLAAMTVAVRGSDQHRAKVGALADLESAAAYLAREGVGVSCPGATAADVASVLATMTGGSNPGVTVSVDGDPDCSQGLPLVSLSAIHQSGRAMESLDVLIGGITVLSPGSGGGPGPGPGPCVFMSVSLGVTYPLNASGNRLNQNLPVSLNYTGSCTGYPAGSLTATVTAVVQNGPNSATLSLIDAGGGVFQATFADDALKFKPGPATISIAGVTMSPLTFTIG